MPAFYGRQKAWRKRMSPYPLSGANTGFRVKRFATAARCVPPHQRETHTATPSALCLVSAPWCRACTTRFAAQARGSLLLNRH